MSLLRNISISLILLFALNLKANDIVSYSIIENNSILAQKDFIDHINQIVIVQPEYLHATAKYYELDQNKKYAQRLRFPTLEAQTQNLRLYLIFWQNFLEHCAVLLPSSETFFSRK